MTTKNNTTGTKSIISYAEFSAGVIDLFIDRGQLSTADIAIHFGLTQPATLYRLRKLIDSGQVECELIRGKFGTYFIWRPINKGRIVHRCGDQPVRPTEPAQGRMRSGFCCSSLATLNTV